MLIRIAEFPQHLSAPIRFQNDSARRYSRLACEPSTRNCADVEEGAVLGQVPILGGIRHLPRVLDVPLQVDQIHHAPRRGCEERGPWKSALRIVSTEAGAAALDGVWLDGCRRLLVKRLRMRG